MATERYLRIILHDMLDAAEKALSFSAGMPRGAFEADPETVFATIRALGVMGEAARNVPKSSRIEHAAGPWSDMAGMRGVLIHDYFGVDPKIVWETLRTDLPPLIVELRQILSATDIVPAAPDGSGSFRASRGNRGVHP